MANFADDVFKNVMKENEEKEAQAFSSITLQEKALVHTASLLMAGTKDSAKLISIAQKEGLSETLMKYADFMFMRGFHEGYTKGRLSTIEE